MKKLAIPLILLLLLSLGYGVKLYSHEINIKITENNEGEVTETFRIGLDPDRYINEFNNTEENIFKNLAAKKGDETEEWTKFHSRIKPTLNKTMNMEISTSKVQKVHKVILNYKAPEVIKLGSKEGRVENYLVKFKSFDFYVKNTGLVIPDNTNLWINLPDNLKEENVKVSPDPVSSFSGYEFRWNTGTWNIKVEYSKVEPISSWSLEGTFESFQETFIGNPAYGISLLVLIILTVIYRKHIKNLFSEGMVIEENAEKPKRKV